MNLRLRGKALGITVAAAALTALTGAMAPSAEAASGPVFTSGYCSSESFDVQCPVTWSGGTAPYTVQWGPGQNIAFSGSGTTSGNSAAPGGNCVPDTLYVVKVTVTDATGLSATTYLGGRCDG